MAPGKSFGKEPAKLFKENFFVCVFKSSLKWDFNYEMQKKIKLLPLHPGKSDCCNMSWEKSPVKGIL